MLRPNSELLRKIQIEDEPNTDRSFDYTATVEQNRKTFLDRVVDGVDKITKAPKAIRQTADNLNNEIVQASRRFQDQAGEVAERNLKENTITGYFSRFGQWIQQGNNLWYSLGGLAVIFYLIRAGK